MIKWVFDYDNSIPRNAANFFFKREKPNITTQVAAKRGETIFHDAQIIIVWVLCNLLSYSSRQQLIFE